MSTPDYGYNVSYPVGEAVVRYRAVIYNTSDDDVEYADAVTEAIIGITQDDQDTVADKVAVRVAGVSYATVDGSGTAIEPDTLLMPEASSDGLLVAHDGSTNSRYVAKALEASSADGDVIRVLLINHQEQAA
jgi:hypothetical protein